MTIKYSDVERGAITVEQFLQHIADEDAGYLSDLPLTDCPDPSDSDVWADEMQELRKAALSRGQP